MKGNIVSGPAPRKRGTVRVKVDRWFLLVILLMAIFSLWLIIFTGHIGAEPITPPELIQPNACWPERDPELCPERSFMPTMMFDNYDNWLRYDCHYKWWIEPPCE